ncbi:hypothetical protein FOA52_002561 [Chlamydomonas sp. UWO 241]|nr:hypothetical protein FOA52_002561 [Chlamydomonas sp. UWO 241]
MKATSRVDSMATMASITETEAAALVAPETAAEEESRLHEEREAKEAKESAEPEVVMDSGRYQALDALLNRSEMYSAFVCEQIAADQQDMDFATAPVPMPATKGTKKGGKRTRSGDAKESEVSATKKMLPMMNVEMRDYQLKGVKWLISLYNNGLNGILADQMGLGKTVQTIGFLSYLRPRGIKGPFRVIGLHSTKGIKGPFLVIGPLSTLPNWIAEFQRFCPGMPALMYHGSRQEREELRRTRLKVTNPLSDDFPVIVTSFEIIIADSKFLQRIKMKYVVVDEGHRLKNFNCKLVRELKTIPAENRLLLSGTPLQNNLDELWSLLNYIMPTTFSDLSDFQGWFNFAGVVGNVAGADAAVIAAEQRNRMVSKLHSILKPFMLRRLKSDVNIGLPEKAELLLYAHMTQHQKDLNLQVLNGTLKAGMKSFADSQGSSMSAGNLNNMLMQMRKIANHPDLVTGPFSGDNMLPEAEEMVRQSGKLQLLERLLKKLKEGGHKVLIFSQMTKMLDLINSYLEQTGHSRVCRIDGSIPWQERQRNIEDFNSDPTTWLFLLSTRAGGLGINLTAADTVIIYDSDWNPHQDLQAMDRCHRIGQTRPCLVLRLASANSVEGKMLRRAADKMALERLVIKKGAFTASASSGGDEASSLSAAELTSLLKCDVSLDDVPQSGVVSDAQMDRLLDRAWLTNSTACPFGTSGVGYEVIQRAQNNATLLPNIEEEGAGAEPASQAGAPSQQAAPEALCA